MKKRNFIVFISLFLLPLILISSCSTPYTPKATSLTENSSAPSADVSYLSGITDGSDNYTQAVIEAVHKGKDGADSLLSALQNKSANVLALEELFSLTLSADKAESRASSDILIQVYFGRAGNLMKSYFFKYISNISTYPEFFNEWISIYKARTDQERIQDVDFVIKSAGNFNAPEQAILFLGLYSGASEPDIKKQIMDFVNNQDNSWWGCILETYLSNPFDKSVYAHFIADCGMPAATELLYYITKLPNTPENIGKYQDLFDSVKPLISDQDFCDAMFSDKYGYIIQEYLKSKVDPYFVNILIDLFNKSKDSSLKQDTIIEIFKFYKIDDNLRDFYLSIINNLDGISNRNALLAAIRLYNGSYIKFDTALALNQKLSMTSEFASDIIEYCADSKIDDTTVKFLANAFMDSKDCRLQVYNYFLQRFSDISMDQYLKGYQHKRVAGAAKSKIAVVEIRDSYRGKGTKYNLSPYSFLLVPEKKRLSVNNTSRAGIVVYLHYTYTHKTLFKVENSPQTVYGYREDCIVTKMDIASGKVLSEAVWEGPALPDSQLFYENAGDFSTDNKTAQEHPERLIAIINK